MKSLFPHFPARMREFILKLLRTSWSFLMLPMLCGALQGATVDLALSITAPADRVSAASNLVYSVSVTNLSSHTATGVRVTNELDPNLSFVSASTSQGSCAHSAGLVVCNAGNLSSGGTLTISIRAQPTVQGEYVTTASVGASQQDENPDDNIMGTRTQVGLADLGMRINNPLEPIVPGDTVTYVVTVTNRGPDATAGYCFASVPNVNADQNILISAVASAGMLDPFEGFQIYWYLPMMQSGDFASLTMTFRVIVAETFGIDGSVLAFPDSNADINYANQYASDSTAVLLGPGILRFSQGASFAVESEGDAEVVVTRSGGSLGTVSVNFTTVNGTAVAGLDYVATNGTLIFTNGQTEKSFQVPLLKHMEFECQKMFSVGLSAPNGGAFLRSRTNALVVVFDDDISPVGVVERVSQPDPNAAESSSSPVNAVGFEMSRDGRWVLFASDASSLVTNDFNGLYDVFLRDVREGTTTLISVNRSGTKSANGQSGLGALSADGRFVTFFSDATDLVTNEVSGAGDIFVRDLITGSTRLVTVNTNGSSGGNGPSGGSLAISSNGMVVVFESLATDLASGAYDTNQSTINMMVRDLNSGTTRLVSVAASSDEPANNNSTYAALTQITPDGRYVLFGSDASNLVTGDSNEHGDLFLRDLQNGTTRLVTVNAAGSGTGTGGPTYAGFVSDDGRYVVFESYASDLVPSDENGQQDVFLRDMVIGATKLVSINQTGTGSGNGLSYAPSTTLDGRYVAFASDAQDLVAGDSGGVRRVFLRDVLSNTTVAVSINCDGAMSEGDHPKISADGRHVVFESRATDLTSGDFRFINNYYSQVFRRDLAKGLTALISPNYSFRGRANGDSRLQDFRTISSNGKAVAFNSFAQDLDSGVGGQYLGTFVWRELPSGTNAELRVTSQVEHRQSVMVISLAVTNYGPDSATGVVVSDTLPVGANFLTANATAGSCIVSSGEVTCSIGNLPRRGGAIITLVATPTADGVVPHVASITGGNADPLHLNNTATASAALMLPPSGVLSIANIGDRNFVNWLSMPASFQVERASTLASPVDWSVISTGIFDNGVMKTLIVTNGFPAHGYYRLHSE